MAPEHGRQSPTVARRTGQQPRLPLRARQFGDHHLHGVNNPNNATNYYYFFYDWTVSTQGIACASDRVPVTVTVTTSGVADLTVVEGSLQCSPTPRKGKSAPMGSGHGRRAL